MLRGAAPVPAWLAPGGVDDGDRTGCTAISMMMSFTPGIVRRHFSTSVLTVSGVLGSGVVSSRLTLTVPSIHAADRTSPKDTMSRLNPGYFTCFRCSLMASGDTVDEMRERKVLTLLTGLRL